MNEKAKTAHRVETVHDELRRMTEETRELRRAIQNEIRRVDAIVHPDVPLRFDGFAPGVAGKLSAIADTVMADVEGVLLKVGWARDDEALRARALTIVLGRDKSLAGKLTDFDRDAILRGYAKNLEVEADRQFWNKPSTPTTSTLTKGALGGQRERVPFADARPELYGSAAMEANRLGNGDLIEGEYRMRRLRVIAKSKGLSLSRSSDRAYCEKLLFQELGEASAFSEAHPEIPDYGRSSRDKPPPGRKPKPDEDDLALMRLTEDARQWCRDIDVPLTEENVMKAKQSLAARDPEAYRVPDYGFGRRK